MKELCKDKFKYFGESCEFRPGAYAISCSTIILGDNVVIRPGSMLFSDPNSQIEIEKDVSLGSGVHIYVGRHEFTSVKLPIIRQGHSIPRSVLVKT